jgi:hypothetical protein
MTIAKIRGRGLDIAGYQFEKYPHRLGGQVITPQGDSLGTIWFSGLMKSWQVISHTRLQTPSFCNLESAFDWLILVDIKAGRALNR